MQYSFIQLIANHLSNIPLPRNPDGFCRECGGPLEISTATAAEGKYKDTWVDEGIIVFKNSPYICPACSKLTGNPARATVIPPKGCVMWANLEDCFPKPAIEINWSSQKLKRDDFYPTKLTLLDFLNNIPEPPFGLVINTGTQNNKHFLRYVPLSYSKKMITALLIGDYKYAQFNTDSLRKAITKGIEKDVQNSNSKLRKEQIKEIAKDLNLTPAEIVVFRNSLKAYER